VVEIGGESLGGGSLFCMGLVERDWEVVDIEVFMQSTQVPWYLGTFVKGLSDKGLVKPFLVSGGFYGAEKGPKGLELRFRG